MGVFKISAALCACGALLVALPCVFFVPGHSAWPTWSQTLTFPLASTLSITNGLKYFDVESMEPASVTYGGIQGNDVKDVYEKYVQAYSNDQTIINTQFFDIKGPQIDLSNELPQGKADFIMLSIATTLSFASTYGAAHVIFDGGSGNLGAGKLWTSGLFALAGVCGVISYSIPTEMTSTTMDTIRRTESIYGPGCCSITFKRERGSTVLLAGSVMMLVGGCGYIAVKMLTDRGYRYLGQGKKNTYVVRTNNGSFVSNASF